MKLFTRITLAAIGSLLFISQTYARDTRYMINYSEALNEPEAKAKLGDDVKFYFGTKTKPAVEKELGEYGSNKKTNAFNKTDAKACKWAFLSAIISLRDRARKVGANAVVGIKSNYKDHLLDNDTQFECGSGSLMAGVALKGTMAVLKK